MSTTRQHCEPGVDDKGPHLDFDAAWKRYCDVIRELEMTAAELEALRNCND